MVANRDAPPPVRWRFGPAVFDEANWTLTVDGRRVPIEVKPLELLRELLRREGAVATKDELLDAIWPDVAVVESSLTTAVLKLRRALGDDRRDARIVETVARFGYRLGVPVARDDAAASPGDRAPVARRRVRPWPMAAGLALALTAGGYAVTAALYPPETPVQVTQAGAVDVLNGLDLPRLRALLAAGWQPDRPFDDQGNNALYMLLATCEWNPAHDRARLMQAARLLIDHGASVSRRNVWGDTAYSIAKAPRYCGPDHPVTRMIRAYCYSGLTNAVSDKCMASYELERQRKPQPSS